MKPPTVGQRVLILGCCVRRLIGAPADVVDLDDREVGVRPVEDEDSRVRYFDKEDLLYFEDK